jgi:hypothetical protein
MNLISFDIGIKNMAYCIFKKDISTNILIHDWNVLNLMDSVEPDHICSCKNKPKTKKGAETLCIKKAKYQKGDQYYCEKHAKDSGFMLPNKKYTTPSLKKLKVDELINLGNSHMCFMNIENIEKKKKSEILEIVNGVFKSKSLEPIVKQRSKTANDTDLIEIGKNMNRLLNQVLQNVDMDRVIIENQISPIANRMKTIQGMLAQYFIIKNENIHIEFVSSSNKLKQFATTKPLKTQKVEPTVLENTLESTEKKDMDKAVYKKHKVDGVAYCSQILSKNPELVTWLSSLTESKKKDDLADCFLQGLWYLRHKNIITYADDLKINSV